MEKSFFEYWAKEKKITKESVSFSVLLDTQKMPFLKHHCFAGQCLVPGAIMADMMVTAASLLNNGKVYPLLINKLEIFRGISIEMNGSISVTVKADCGDEGSINVVLLSEVRNKKGVTVRKNVRVASANMNLEQQLERDFVSIAEPDDSLYYRFDQQHFYDLFVKTHGDLFQTLTGDFTLSPDRNFLRCQYNIADQEDYFSEKNMLQFILSPLGLDSMLQMAVTFSVLNPPEGKEDYYTKLPIGLENFYLKEPTLFNQEYFVIGSIITQDESEIELKTSIVDNNSNYYGGAGKIRLRMAPYEKQNSLVIQSLLQNHIGKN